MDQDVITFESIISLVIKGKKIPIVHVSYKGELVAILCQYLNSIPNPEGIENGQWFALPAQRNSVVSEAILNIAPAGQPLDQLKIVVAKILKEG